MYKKMSSIMRGTVQAMLDCIEKNNVAYFVATNIQDRPDTGYKLATEPMDSTSFYIHNVKIDEVGWIVHICYTTQVSDEESVKHSYWYDGADEGWINERLEQMNERAHITQSSKELESKYES